MDDQIRRLMTNQITFDRFQRPVEISQASLMRLGVAQCHAVDIDIPGIITMHIVFFYCSELPWSENTVLH